MRTLTGRPLLGSTPSSRAWVASLRSTFSITCSTWSMNGRQNSRSTGTQSSSPREMASSSSSSRAVKS